MKCENHPSVNAVNQCNNCEIPLCGFCSRYSGDAIYCEKCEQSASLSSFVEKKSQQKQDSAMGALLKAGEEEEARRPAIEDRSDSGSPVRSEKVQIAVVLLCCLIIVVQITRSLGSGTVMNQQQIAAQEQTRDQIESCMLVFWEIALRFTNNEPLANNLRCPDSTMPLIVTRTENDIVVRHPQPGALGLTDIYISRSNPTPILVE